MSVQQLLSALIFLPKNFVESESLFGHLSWKKENNNYHIPPAVDETPVPIEF